MSLAVDIPERRVGQDMLGDYALSPSSCSSCSGVGSETHGSQKDLYVPMHRRISTGTSQTSTAPTSVACSPREGTKSLPSYRDREQRTRTRSSPSFYTREELLTLAPSSLIHASLHPVVTPALVSKFPTILRFKGDGIAKALEMSRTPVNRHTFFSLPPVPEPFPIPTQNTGFQRVRKLHPQVASAVSPYHSSHLHSLLWTQDSLRHAHAQYGYPHFTQPTVEFSLPPVRPKPTLRPADDVCQMPGQQPSQQKMQSEGLGPDPAVVATRVASNPDKEDVASAETVVSQSPAPNQTESESTPAQERRRRRQRDRRRRQRAKQVTTTAVTNVNEPYAARDKESSGSPSLALPDASSKGLASPRKRSASAPLRQHIPLNIPKRQRQPSNFAGFDKQTRQHQPSSIPGFDKQRRGAAGNGQTPLKASGAAQISTLAHTQAQHIRKAFSKTTQAQHEAEAGHRFRLAHAGEPESWRARRPMQVAPANAA